MKIRFNIMVSPIDRQGPTETLWVREDLSFIPHKGMKIVGDPLGGSRAVVDVTYDMDRQYVSVDLEPLEVPRTMFEQQVAWLETRGWKDSASDKLA